jgi:hypothetical protein
MPAVFIPGEPVVVTVSVSPQANPLAFAVEDQPPAGWAISRISDQGEWDATNGKVKWGPFLDNQPRVLSYALTPPVNAATAISFAGRGSFDGTSLATRGVIEMCPGCRLTAHCGATPGQVSLALAGPIGTAFVIDASTDLVNWTPMTIVTNTSASVTFTDPEAGRFSHRFYRVQMVP